MEDDYEPRHAYKLYYTNSFLVWSWNKVDWNLSHWPEQLFRRYQGRQYPDETVSYSDGFTPCHSLAGHAYCYRNRIEGKFGTVPYRLVTGDLAIVWRSFNFKCCGTDWCTDRERSVKGVSTASLDRP